MNDFTFLDALTDKSRYILSDYVEHVINGMTHARYRTVIQTGKKAGESLFTHVLNGVLVLETLRPELQLQDDEARALYTAFTIHDLNKVTDEQVSFSQLVTPERVAEEIQRLQLGAFFPDWQTYLQDITSLIRGHSGHYSVSTEMLMPKREAAYALGMSRVKALTQLMRAADILGLSHTLDEQQHKQTFLSHLNRYLSESGLDRQFELHTHRLVEQRGLLTNVMHNAFMAVLAAYGWRVLLLYADGVVYLAPRGSAPPEIDTLRCSLGAGVASQIRQIVAGSPNDLIEQTAQGIKFKPDAFTSGQPFSALMGAVRNFVSRRRFKPDDLEAKARERIRAALERLAQKSPERAVALDSFLGSRSKLISASDEQLRVAELARTYYILLTDYMPEVTKPWQRLYQLLEVPLDLHALFDEFDARYDRPYVLADSIPLTEEEVYARILADGNELWERMTGAGAGDENAELWTHYVERYALVDGLLLAPGEWSDHLVHYIENQHQQCIHCSSPFPTQPLRAADVRDGIEVQKFSNRLSGGGAREPVKSICRVCRTQFLIEALTFDGVKGESLFYLHIFPRTFTTSAFTEGMRRAYRRIRDGGADFRALHMDVETALKGLRADDPEPLLPRFHLHTKAGKPHTYGVYVPKFDATLAGLMVMPLNAPGENDTENYLFALWYALVLGQYFGGKVILTREPTPPLIADHLPDLFLDTMPLGASGLLRYDSYDGDADSAGSLGELEDAVYRLFELRRILSPREDVMPQLVRALGTSPLHIFFEADRILEAKKRDFSARDAHEHLVALAINLGGYRMAQLSEALTHLAAHAWEHRLRGRSLERSSLLYPVKTIFEKLSQQRREHDREFIIALTCEDIFAHLDRIQEGEFKIGRAKREAIEQFVRGWYELVVDGVYAGQVQRLLADEKALMSAFLFYIKSQIPRRTQEDKENA